ncbi:MAG: hypothetical protein RIR00_923, partial [Pseudomonadota bacterium]
MAQSGKKVKLTLTACDVQGGKFTPRKSPVFVAMLNPSSYKHSQNITYNTETAPGKAGQEAKFANVGQEKLNFSFLLDGTGVIEAVTADNSVDKRIEQLRAVVYNYNGKQHEPNGVRVLWGSFIFFGRLESLNLDYTLFKPSGEPLRAKVDLAFIGSMGRKQESLVAQRSSPDMTHVIVVRAGDSLPLLCHQIYRDASLYVQVARYNRLDNFRQLRPGQTLYFPPL